MKIVKATLAAMYVLLCTYVHNITFITYQNPVLPIYVANENAKKLIKCLF